MSQIKDVLAELAKVEGVLAVLVVGRDGFVIEGISTEDVDLEGVAAIVASNMAAAEAMGTEMVRGMIRGLLMEFEEGPVAVGPLPPGPRPRGAFCGTAATTEGKRPRAYTLRKVTAPMITPSPRRAVLRRWGLRFALNAYGFSALESMIVVTLLGVVMGMSVSGMRHAVARERVDGWVRTMTYDIAA